MKAATIEFFLLWIEVVISIHAAREGGDPLAFKLRVRLEISIHAAREGGDSALRAAKLLTLKISIHAAREGGDLRQAAPSVKLYGFQSTPPVKAATRHSAQPSRGGSYFNPRRP